MEGKEGREGRGREGKGGEEKGGEGEGLERSWKYCTVTVTVLESIGYYQGLGWDRCSCRDEIPTF